jgi:hypothetical protein
MDRRTWLADEARCRGHKNSPSLGFGQPAKVDGRWFDRASRGWRSCVRTSRTGLTRAFQRMQCHHSVTCCLTLLQRKSPWGRAVRYKLIVFIGLSIPENSLVLNVARSSRRGRDRQHKLALFCPLWGKSAQPPPMWVPSTRSVFTSLDANATSSRGMNWLDCWKRLCFAVQARLPELDAQTYDILTRPSNCATLGFPFEGRGFRHGEDVAYPQRANCRRYPRWAKVTRPQSFFANEPNGCRQRDRNHVPASSEIREGSQPRGSIAPATNQ